jgi:uncharacterized protein
MADGVKYNPNKPNDSVLAREQFPAVSVKLAAGARRLDRVLAQFSTLVEIYADPTTGKVDWSGAKSPFAPDPAVVAAAAPAAAAPAAPAVVAAAAPAAAAPAAPAVVAAAAPAAAAVGAPVVAGSAAAAAVAPAAAFTPKPPAKVLGAITATGGDPGKDIDGPSIVGAGLLASKAGIYALEDIDIFNILCIPPFSAADDGTQSAVGADTWQTALGYCKQRNAMLMVDPNPTWSSASTFNDFLSNPGAYLEDLNLVGEAARNAAIFFPNLMMPDSLLNGAVVNRVPCGVMAGIFARTDVTRGVWKAPAGIDATLAGVSDFEVNLTDAQNGQLNPYGINCLRSFPVYGRVVWGSRTARGADMIADEYKYIPVRRLALYLEASLSRGLKWVVFEPNGDALWAQIRLNVGAFMNNLFRRGAFYGQSKDEAYFVKCDAETTTQNDRDLGIVNILVGFAPLEPAEFVVLQIQQMAGQIDT